MILKRLASLQSLSKCLQQFKRTLRQLCIFISLSLNLIAKGGHNSKINIHRLEVAHTFVAHVKCQCSDGALTGEVHSFPAQKTVGKLYARKEAGSHVKIVCVTHLQMNEVPEDLEIYTITEEEAAQ